MQVSKTHIYFQPLLPLDVHEVQGSKDQALHAKVTKSPLLSSIENADFEVLKSPGAAYIIFCDIK